MSVTGEQALEHLQNDPGAFELHLLLEALPEDVRKRLTEAYERYTHLIGLCSGVIDEDVVAADRSCYPDLVATDDQGLIIFDHNKAPRFMSEVSELSLLLCQLYLVNDNNWLAASGYAAHNYGHSTMKEIELLIAQGNAQ